MEERISFATLHFTEQPILSKHSCLQNEDCFPHSICLGPKCRGTKVSRTKVSRTKVSYNLFNPSLYRHTLTLRHPSPSGKNGSDPLTRYTVTIPPYPSPFGQKDCNPRTRYYVTGMTSHIDTFTHSISN